MTITPEGPTAGPGSPPRPFRGPNAFRAIWDASEDAMVLTDAMGTVLAANRAYCTLHRCSPRGLIGRSLALIVPEAERPFAVSQYRAVFESMELAEPHPAIVQWRDGSERVVESRVDLLVQDNRRAAMMSTVRVLTEQPGAAGVTTSNGALRMANAGELVQTTADVLIDAIHRWGIEAFFGLPGESVSDLMDDHRQVQSTDERDDAGATPSKGQAAARLDRWEDDGGATGSQRLGPVDVSQPRV